MISENEVSEEYYYSLLINLYSREALNESSMKKLAEIKAKLEDATFDEAEYLVSLDISDLPPPDELRKELQNGK